MREVSSPLFLWSWYFQPPSLPLSPFLLLPACRMRKVLAYMATHSLLKPLELFYNICSQYVVHIHQPGIHSISQRPPHSGLMCFLLPGPGASRAELLKNPHSKQQHRVFHIVCCSFRYYPTCSFIPIPNHPCLRFTINGVSSYSTHISMLNVSPNYLLYGLCVWLLSPWFINWKILGGLALLK